MTIPLSRMLRLIVPRSLADEGQELLREEGVKAHEALLVWAGSARPDAIGTFDVEALIMPRQIAYVSDDGVAVMVNGDAIFEMNVLLNERGMRLLAQLHTHPGRAYHSDTDDAFSLITAEGGLSIVVPDFATGPFNLQQCAVYRLENGEWAMLESAAVCELVQIEEA